MDWIPTLESHPGPAYEVIVDALGADIASGRLHRGQRLPTHRAEQNEEYQHTLKEHLHDE